MSNTPCTHHNDQQREECPVCLVTALTAERDQLRSDCAFETKWASHYLAQSIAEKARADKAEAVLADPQQLHAHCLRNLNEGQIAHLFGERMTEIVNRAARAEADLAAERLRSATARRLGVATLALTHGSTASLKSMKTEKLFFVFDVESIGLHGEGFAVGWVVVSETGATYEESYLACLPGAARGSASSREWVEKNIPAIPVTHNTPIAVRDAFWGVWKTWKNNGAVLVADCCWPVEARFLAQCVDDNLEAREWDGPYPLLDVSSALLVRGEDPLLTRDRLPAELPAHHPLKDAKQSARILLSALGPSNTSFARSAKNEKP